MSSRLTSFGRYLHRRYLEPEYPPLLVEVGLGAVSVVRLARERGTLKLQAAVRQEWPEAPAPGDGQLVAPAAFKAALRGALERAGALGAARACLVLPDSVGRLVLVPAAELRAARAKQFDALLRFRLRKVLPFDVALARLAHTPVGRATEFVAVAAVARPELERYENALQELGLRAGLVELAGWALTVAALAAHPAQDRLVINWESDHVTLVLCRAGQPVLVRTLRGAGAAAPEEVQREVFNTVFYYRERLGGAGLAGATLRSTALPPAEAVACLREPLALDAELVDPWKASRAACEATPVPHELALGLAALLGRVA